MKLLYMIHSSCHVIPSTLQHSASGSAIAAHTSVKLSAHHLPKVQCVSAVYAEPSASSTVRQCSSSYMQHVLDEQTYCLCSCA
jgi:hypothetical protein